MVLSCHGFLQIQQNNIITEGVAGDLQPCDVTCICSIVTLSIHSPNISMLNGGWLFGCIVCMSIWAYISLSCVITCDCACAYFCAYAYGKMTEAEWLISGMCMCDKRRELDRGETLSLKKKGKWGLTSEETDGQRRLTLRLKTNKKLGFAGKETEARCFGLKFNEHFHVWYMSSNCLCITHGIKSHSSSPPDDHHLPSSQIYL